MGLNDNVDVLRNDLLKFLGTRADSSDESADEEWQRFVDGIRPPKAEENNTAQLLQEPYVFDEDSLRALTKSAEHTGRIRRRKRL